MQSIRDMYDQGEWVDVTKVGDLYEEHYNQKTGQSRYREHPKRPGDTPAEWRYGKPPRRGA